MVVHENQRSGTGKSLVTKGSGLLKNNSTWGDGWGRVGAGERTLIVVRAQARILIVFQEFRFLRGVFVPELC